MPMGDAERKFLSFQKTLMICVIIIFVSGVVFLSSTKYVVDAAKKAEHESQGKVKVTHLVAIDANISF